MSVIYASYEKVKQEAIKNRDYRIRFKVRKKNRVVIAIHGGNIEPGTSEIAEAIAGDEHSFYTFEGISPSGNYKFHITSTNFDEPCGVGLIKSAKKVLSIHGYRDDACVLYIGGRDIELGNRMLNALNKVGFNARERQNSNMKGISPRNICNRGVGSKGVQMEISSRLRNRMYKGFYKNGKRIKTELFYQFIRIVSEVFGSDTNNQTE
jgi:phage replication-related protein YjqB (UPF0714/DUF867 family)